MLPPRRVFDLLLAATNFVEPATGGHSRLRFPDQGAPAPPVRLGQQCLAPALECTTPVPPAAALKCVYAVPIREHPTL